MSKNTKLNWYCVKCKFDTSTVSQSPDNIIQIRILVANTSPNNNINDLTDSVKFMSSMFDNFGEQIKDVAASLREMREENKVLKAY